MVKLIQISILLFYSGSEAPEALRKLHWLADDGDGWIQVVLSMIHVIPLDNPLSPALITVILDDCPLPDKVYILKIMGKKCDIITLFCVLFSKF